VGKNGPRKCNINTFRSRFRGFFFGLFWVIVFDEKLGLSLFFFHLGKRLKVHLRLLARKIFLTAGLAGKAALVPPKITKRNIGLAAPGDDCQTRDFLPQNRFFLRGRKTFVKFRPFAETCRSECWIQMLRQPIWYGPRWPVRPHFLAQCGDVPVFLRERWKMGESVIGSPKCLGFS